MNRKWKIAAGVVVLVVGLGFAAWQVVLTPGGAEAQAQTGAETAVVERGTLHVTVGGTGNLVPISEVALAFTAGGQLAEVLVEEGQTVEAGQALARLDTDELAWDVAQAEAGLAHAEGQLAELLASPRPEDVAVQEANLAAAQGRVSAAVANRDQVIADPDEAEVAAAEAQVAAAELEHRNALITYDRIEGNGDDKDRAHHDLWAAEVGVEAAQKQLDEVLVGADADEVRAAQANVASAVARRDAVQAQLDLLLVGPTDEQVQAAEAAVEQARVALEQAQVRLQKATLVAPASGTISSLGVDAGEMVAPGQTIVVLSDLSALEVDVDLDETDVARVVVGQPATVTLDAFPGVELTGEVTYSAPDALVLSGVVLYPVTVRLSPEALIHRGVRAGMTAEVEITTASREDALIVPLRAVRTEGQRAYVTRVVGEGVEQVEVELGLTTETQAEILGGVDGTSIAEGDAIVVVPAPAGAQFQGPFAGLRGGQ